VLGSAPQLLIAWVGSSALELGKASDPTTWRAWLTSADRSTLVLVGLTVLLVTCLGFWAPRDAVEAQRPESEP
jgi:hypothetical protein